MKYKKLLPLFLTSVLIFAGCGNTEQIPQTDLANGVDFSQVPVDDMFTERDLRTTYEENVYYITLNGTSASCDADTVSISGSTITIKDEGTYVFSGTLNDGSIIVEAEENDKPQIVLNDVTINSSTTAPICVLEADKVFITLEENTTNTLSNNGTFSTVGDENIDGIIYSKADLTFNGSGSLILNSEAGHGIVAKDDLVFTGGTYNITCSSHGIDANDSLRIKDVNLTIAAGKDGAHVENNDDTSLGFIYIENGNFDIVAEGDGLSASAYMQIAGGNFNLLIGGGFENGSQSSSDNYGGYGGGMGGPGGPGGHPGNGGRSGGTSSSLDTDSSTGTTGSTTDESSTSMKGLKATTGILITNGTFNIDSADDSIHSDTSAYIKGGTFTIASGDDAIHAEATLEITAGTIDISNSYEGLEALYIVVSGGDISIQSTDDGINAAGGTDASGTTGGRDGKYGGMYGGMSSNSNGKITISGGNIFMYAKGDGLDANGSLEISGGYIIVTGPTQGDTAILDYDTSATITGGTFIGVGSTMMAQTFSDGTQGTMAVQASASAGTQIRILDSNGKEIISYTPSTAYQCVIISTPDMTIGESYTIYVGSASGTFAAQ